MADAETIFTPWRKYGCVCARMCVWVCGCGGGGDCVYVCLNTKVRCKPRNAINFNQKVKMLKTLSFRYDTET